MEVPRASRGLCEGACLQTRGPAPSRLDFSTPKVCPSSRPGAFAFSHQLERRGATRAPASRAGATAAPMAPSTLWVALVIELQLWAVGHTVPAQVGASQGHGGGKSSALRSAHRGNTTIPGQLALSHPQPTRATRPWGATGTRSLAHWEPGVEFGSRQP